MRLEQLEQIQQNCPTTGNVWYVNPTDLEEIRKGLAPPAAAPASICNCGDPMFLPHRSTCPVVCRT